MENFACSRCKCNAKAPAVKKVKTGFEIWNDLNETTTANVMSIVWHYLEVNQTLHSIAFINFLLKSNDVKKERREDLNCEATELNTGQ